MEKRILLDWLRVTFAQTSILDEFIDTFGLTPSAANPVGFYNSAVTLSAKGVRVGDVCWHTEKPQQRVQFTFTGQDLDKWRSAEQITALLAFVVRHGGRFTRIDIAIDILESVEAQVDVLARAAERGDMTTHAKTFSVIRGVNNGVKGTTLYLGNRQSDKFLRCYDKAAEQGINGLWTRIELEAKGDYARALGPRIAEEGIDIGRAEIDKFVAFDFKFWTEAVGMGAKYDRVDVDRSAGNRERWQNTVLLGMVKDAATENRFFRAKLLQFLRTTNLFDNSEH